MWNSPTQVQHYHSTISCHLCVWNSPHNIDSALPFHYLVSPLHVEQSNTMLIQLYHSTILCHLCVEQSNTVLIQRYHSTILCHLCTWNSQSQCWFSCTVPLSCVTSPCRTVQHHVHSVLPFHYLVSALCGTIQHNVDSAVPFHYLVPSLCGTVQHSVDSALPFHYLVSPLHMEQSITVLIQLYHSTVLCHLSM